MAERGRPTKWAGTSARFVQIGGAKLDTIITGHLTQEQIVAYQQYFRVEEISDLLRKSGRGASQLLSVLPSAKAENYRRDPSPPPQYDQNGNRTNTRELRTLNDLKTERHGLVEAALTSIKNYDPPADYNKPAKTSEKLYIPAKEYPDINFVGLLLGPRGNTLRQLQENSGAKLAIRGKGSVKDGKLSNSQEDELHVVISAETTARIQKAIQLTNEVIEKAISSPFGQNDLKRDQLRELAVLNGTLRESKPYVPPDMFNQAKSSSVDITLIVCRICGNVGHYSRDCKLKPAKELGSYSPPSSQVPYQSPREDQPPWKRQRLDEFGGHVRESTSPEFLGRTNRDSYAPPQNVRLEQQTTANYPSPGLPSFMNGPPRFPPPPPPNQGQDSFGTPAPPPGVVQKPRVPPPPPPALSATKIPRSGDVPPPPPSSSYGTAATNTSKPPPPPPPPPTT